MMKNKHIAKLEAQLEHIIEGAFANLFGKTINAQDIALRLSRAMEDNLQLTQKLHIKLHQTNMLSTPIQIYISNY